MPIVVQHQPPASALAGAGYRAGLQQFLNERDRQRRERQARQQELALRLEASERETAARIQAQREGQRLNVASQLWRDERRFEEARGAEERARLAQEEAAGQLFDQQMARDEQSQAATLRREQFGALSPRRKRTMARLGLMRERVLGDPTLTDPERQMALADIDRREGILLDTPSSEDQPRTIEQELEGRRFVDPDTGTVWYLQPDGKIETRNLPTPEEDAADRAVTVRTARMTHNRTVRAAEVAAAVELLKLAPAVAGGPRPYPTLQDALAALKETWRPFYWREDQPQPPAAAGMAPGAEAGAEAEAAEVARVLASGQVPTTQPAPAPAPRPGPTTRPAPTIRPTETFRPTFGGGAPEQPVGPSVEEDLQLESLLRPSGPELETGRTLERAPEAVQGWGERGWKDNPTVQETAYARSQPPLGNHVTLTWWSARTNLDPGASNDAKAALRELYEAIFARGTHINELSDLLSRLTSNQRKAVFEALSETGTLQEMRNQVDQGGS